MRWQDEKNGNVGERLRYIKPDYYDDFRCIAGRCPATCCAGWQIVVDEDSLERYARVKGGFGHRLRNSIDWAEGVFYQYDRRCAFLNEENLCDLQSRLGEEALCETCKRYPRHVEEYDGLREYSLSLSCPQAARIMLEYQGKVGWVQWETEEEDDFEDFDFLMFTQLEDTREVMFQIIQNRELALPLRMRKLLKFARGLQHCVDEGRIYDIDEVIETQARTVMVWDDDDPEEAGGFSDSMESMVRDFAVFYRMEHLSGQWEERLERMGKLLYEQGEKNYREIYTRFQQTCGYQSPGRQEWEREGEQLLLFFVYTYFCGAVYDDMVYTKIALSVFSVRWIQEFYMAAWAEEPEKTDKEELIRTAYSYAREVEHSDLNLDILEKWMDRNWKEE